MKPPIICISGQRSLKTKALKCEQMERDFFVVVSSVIAKPNSLIFP